MVKIHDIYVLRVIAFVGQTLRGKRSSALIRLKSKFTTSYCAASQRLVIRPKSFRDASLYIFL